MHVDGVRVLLYIVFCVILYIVGRQDPQGKDAAHQGGVPGRRLQGPRHELVSQHTTAVPGIGVEAYRSSTNSRGSGSS